MGGHIKQYARQTSEPLEKVYEKFGYELPVIPEGFGEIWLWFWELSDGRQNSGFGPSPVSYGDMAAWAALSGLGLAPWLMRIFRAMDNEWLAAQAEEAKKRSKGKK